MKKAHLKALRDVIEFAENSDMYTRLPSKETWELAREALRAIKQERHNGFNAARRSVVAILKRDGTLTMPDGSYSHVLPEQLREWLGEKLK
jgi:hypothetical protein